LRNPRVLLTALSLTLALACLANGEVEVALLIASTAVVLELASRWAGVEDYGED